MRMSNVYSAGTDANPNANHDPSTKPDPTLTLGLKLDGDDVHTGQELWNECYSSN